MAELKKTHTGRRFAYFLLIFSSVFMYIAITLTRNLYTAEKTTLLSLGSFGNLSDLASTTEYFFYTYAIMQVLLIFFVDKINTKWFLTVTLGVAGVLSIFTAMTDTIVQHYLIYAANGFLQAGIWGGLIKILSQYLPTRLLPTANTLMTSAPAVASALAYGIAALFGEDWRTPFALMGVIVIGSVVLFFVSVTTVTRYPREIEMHRIVLADGSEREVDNEEDNDFIHLDSPRRIALFYIISVIMGFVLTSIYFMVLNNLDIYIKEIGGYSNGVSKALTIVAPIVAVFGPALTVRACERHRNFIAVSAVFFVIALVSVVVLLFVYDTSVIFSLFLFILFITESNGGRSTILSIASFRMRAKINSGVYTTAVNAASSITSGLAPKILTVILDNEALSTVESWKNALLVVTGINAFAVAALLGLVLLIRFANAGRKSNI